MEKNVISQKITAAERQRTEHTKADTFEEQKCDFNRLSMNPGHSLNLQTSCTNAHLFWHPCPCYQYFGRPDMLGRVQARTLRMTPAMHNIAVQMTGPTYNGRPILSAHKRSGPIPDWECSSLENGTIQAYMSPVLITLLCVPGLLKWLYVRCLLPDSMRRFTTAAEAWQ
jgi:hypothetical protein